jgi:hypothetical protein
VRRWSGPLLVVMVAVACENYKSPTAPVPPPTPVASPTAGSTPTPAATPSPLPTLAPTPTTTPAPCVDLAGQWAARYAVCASAGSGVATVTQAGCAVLVDVPGFGSVAATARPAGVLPRVENSRMTVTTPPCARCTGCGADPASDDGRSITWTLYTPPGLCPECPPFNTGTITLTITPQ